MELAMILEHLAMAERHVTEGEQRIDKQRALIARLQHDGHNTDAALALLERFQELLTMQKADRERLQAELKRYR
jgi:hypothetical protein